MNIDFAAVGGTAYTVAGSMIIAYGATRIGATLFQELRNAVFASVAQKAIRRVACNVYDHLLRLDLNFHLSRQTGGLTRAIDRGTKGISFLLTSMVFHVLPTALEIGLVCSILVGVVTLAPRDQLRLLYLADLSIWSQICGRYSHYNGCIYCFYYYYNVLENKVSKTSQCS